MAVGLVPWACLVGEGGLGEQASLKTALFDGAAIEYELVFPEFGARIGCLRRRHVPLKR